MTDYFIVTPAYNEERYIGLTIDSVLAQTHLPKLWIIVDDGSTEKTAQIIQDRAKTCHWIHYLFRAKIARQMYYASNVFAIEEGLKQIHGYQYDYLAILDADISLPSDYYEKIFGCFNRNEKLGIASGVYVVRDGDKLGKVLNDRRFCPKSIMVFRQKCFEDVGGFIPLKYGAEDNCACFTARMKGWKVWSYPEIEVIHNKPVGTGHAKGTLKIRFRQGVGEYFLATHPLFLLLKAIRRFALEKPFLLSGLARIAGFIYGHFMGQQRQIPPEVVRYIRQEQWHRIWNHNHIPQEFRAQ